MEAQTANVPGSEPIPVLTLGVEPSSGQSHSPPSSLPNEGIWGIKLEKTPKVNGEVVELGKPPEEVKQPTDAQLPKSGGRKRIVVVGLGMVGISFM